VAPSGHTSRPKTTACSRLLNTPQNIITCWIATAPLSRIACGTYHPLTAAEAKISRISSTQATSTNRAARGTRAQYSADITMPTMVATNIGELPRRTV